jgi:hypothetical protein
MIQIFFCSISLEIITIKMTTVKYTLKLIFDIKLSAVTKKTQKLYLNDKYTNIGKNFHLASD